MLTPFLNAAEKARNVVFILVDDLGVNDINLDGSDPFYETPNLAKFAKTAVNFATNGYAGCPVCSPTRSAIMTGQNPTRTHHTDYFGAPNEFKNSVPPNYDPKEIFIKNPEKLPKHGNYPVWPAPYVDNLAASHTTLPEALQKQGYSTFFAGKWHLGGEGFLPQDNGFDINMGGTDKGGPYGGDKYFSPYGNPQLADGPKGEHITERLGRETAKFITENKDKPFLAYLSFYAVHQPIMAPEAVSSLPTTAASPLPKDRPPPTFPTAPGKAGFTKAASASPCSSAILSGAGAYRTAKNPDFKGAFKKW